MKRVNSTTKPTSLPAKTPHYIKRKILGVTLVELMVAITIGSIVALGIGSVYTSSKRSFKLQEEFSRLQENGRFAMNYIARFVRGAGYSGCNSALDNMVDNISGDSSEYEFNTGIQGFEYTGSSPGQSAITLSDFPSAVSSGDASDFVSISSAIPTTLLGRLDPVPNTDILISRSTEGSGIEITNNNNAANLQISFDSKVTDGCGTNKDSYNDLCIGDSLIVSDCEKSIVFLITNLTPNPAGPNPTDVLVGHAGTNVGVDNNTNIETSFGGASGNLQEYEFDTGSEIVKATTKYFYVGAGVNGPALFVKNGTRDPIELVEGVESIQVLYGEDTDATPDNIPDHFVPADHISDFGNVSAVRVSLLLRSVKELPWRTAQNKPFRMGGSTDATATVINSPADKRLRRVMTMTIKLRNRAFSL